MKVIILKQINSLGRKGEIKDVAEGYGRNYLLPQNLAVLATDDNVKKFSQTTAEKSSIKLKAKKTKFGSPAEIAASLRSLVINFVEKADDNGTLFAGITKEKLLRVLNDKGYNFKPKQIELGEPIKKLGEHKIPVNVASSFKSEIKVIVKNSKS